jgi:D-arabinitol 4-dehydrogenase
MSTSTHNVMLHLGLGSFHRAHQACYLQALMNQGDSSWSIAAGNLRPDMADTVAALRAQEGQYTLETVSPEGVLTYQRITSIREIVPFDAQLNGLVEFAQRPSTRIISFTVTEAGYYLDEHNKLDTAAPDIARDLAVASGTAAPSEQGSTIYGAMSRLLRARMDAGAGPLTLLNCDNLRHNGERFRKGFLQFLQALGAHELLSWVEAHTACPNAMVDRITPRPTPEVAARVLSATGIADAAPVMAESFIQWVIEDRFVAGRPAWERVGVEMVSSVDAYEEAKIRLLNATHSCIAWAGTLVGFQYIHEGTRHPVIRQLAYDYVTNDTIPVLDTADAPSPIDLRKYRDVVLDRFANPAIRDTNQRVAMDGFSKIPGFIAPTIRERLARGESIASVSVLPALFLTFLHRWHAGAVSFVYQDQAMNPDTAHAMCDAQDPVAAFAADTTLWGELASDPRLTQALRTAQARVNQFLKEVPHV